MDRPGDRLSEDRFSEWNRRARTCYDHLAGQIAVAMADRMVERGQIDLSPDGGALTDDGTAFLLTLGVDLDAATASAARRGGGRTFCSPVPGSGAVLHSFAISPSFPSVGLPASLRLVGPSTAQ